ALQAGGEIVNCDAVQMIRHRNIGTTKPSREERKQVPHHLFDTIDPDQSYSAGAYMKDAREVCHLIAARGMIP
ncbi:MAG: tRNA (adenosine(37)-N6)-dimethylallyltransferase MiaA, partial [bacterium]